MRNNDYRDATNGLTNRGEVNITVSIVEDDTPAREIMLEWINSEPGFECVGAHASVEEALTRLPEEKPAVALMDINLPGLSGIEGVRRLKLLLPGTQFVMLTVYEDSDHIFNALMAGASGYLLKNTLREDLFSALRDVHAGGSPMTSNIARKVVVAFQQMGTQQSEAGDLSPREREVLELLARGYLYKEIADALRLSVPTVNTHTRHIYEKLHVRSRAQAVAKFAQFPGVGNVGGGKK